MSEGICPSRALYSFLAASSTTKGVCCRVHRSTSRFFTSVVLPVQQAPNTAVWHSSAENGITAGAPLPSTRPAVTPAAVMGRTTGNSSRQLSSSTGFCT